MLPKPGRHRAILPPLLRVYVVIYLQSPVAVVILHCFLDNAQRLPHTAVVEAVFQFKHNLPYIQQFYPAYGRLVGTEDTGAEELAQTVAEVGGGIAHHVVVAML
mgnify:CR=1 FL=1